ncbi:MAG: hypothetical protein U1E78_09135 [Gammaproteobacteria bacterium]
MSYNDIQTEHGKQVEKLKKNTALKRKDLLSEQDDIFAPVATSHPSQTQSLQNNETFSTLVKEHYAAELKTEKGLVAQSYDGWFTWTPMIHTASRKEIETRALKNLTLKALEAQALAEAAKHRLDTLDITFNKAHQNLEDALSNLEEKKNTLDHINASLNALEAEFHIFNETAHTLDAKLKSIDPALELPEVRNWHDIKTFLEYVGLKQNTLETVKEALSIHPEYLAEFEAYQTMREMQVNLRETYDKTISDRHQAERGYAEANEQYDHNLLQFKQSLENLQSAQAEIVETFNLNSIDQLNQYIALKDVLGQLYLQGSPHAEYVMPHLAEELPQATPSTPLVSEPTPPPAPVITLPEFEPVKPHFD